jgi:cell division protein FtsW (lipid II flippase)
MKKKKNILPAPLANKNGNTIELGGIDWFFFILVFALVVFGLICVDSASSPKSQHNASTVYENIGAGYAVKQFIFAVIGFVGLGILSIKAKFIIRFLMWKPVVITAYLATILLLCAVLVWGTDANGTGLKRSLDLGMFTLQPSEMAKFIIPYAMAHFIYHHYTAFTIRNPFEWKYWKGAILETETSKKFVFVLIFLYGLLITGVSIFMPAFYDDMPIKFWVIIALLVLCAVHLFLYGSHIYKYILTPMVIGIVPILLVLAEFHKSAVIILGAIFILTLFVSNLSPKLFWAIIALAIAGIGCIFLFSDMAKERAGHFGTNVYEDFKYFEDWDQADRDAEWQTYNSLVAIGSGGFFGLGFAESRQKYFYLPEPQNDFIFSIICEEMGFVVAFAILVVFIILVTRGIYIATHVQNDFLAILAAVIMFHIAIQVIFNIIVVTGIFNTGITLPFFSYGGSALITLLIEMGVVLAISRYVPKSYRR